MNKTVRRSVTGVAALVVLSIMALGSESPPKRIYTTSYKPVPIKFGTLVNENLRIEGVGPSWGSNWSVNGGEDFTTPFSVYWWQGRGPKLSTSDNSLLESHQEAYRNGARPVLIHIDGVDEPLHGLIVFNSAVEAAFGPAKQSYYVKIPEQKLRQALNGINAVAYERMSWKSSWTYAGSRKSSNKKYFSWILWMSRTPLVEDRPAFERKVN